MLGIGIHWKRKSIVNWMTPSRQLRALPKDLSDFPPALNDH